MLRKIPLFTVMLAGVVASGVAHAQQSTLTIDDRVLTQLYEAQLKSPGDTYLEKRIAEERARIRSLIDEDLNGLINTLTNPSSDAENPATDLADAVTRQRGVVELLQGRLDEAHVDRELLDEEEKKYYLEPDQVLEEEQEAYRLTQSHSELLAKKAILDESIAATEFFLVPQRERLSKLTFQERLVQFSVVISFAQYLGFLLAIILVERLIRTKLLVRIGNRNRRYTAIKVFTTGVYALLILGVLSRVFAEYPGIITSFAIVGAGLAVAMQDLVKDIVGWFLIVQGRQFTLGQRVSIGQHTGDVVDVSFLRTTLLEVGTSGTMDLERTGRTLYIPNAAVLGQPVLNYNTTSDFIKAEMSVLITRESPWETAKKILLEILEEETGEFTHRARRQSTSRTQQFYFSHEMKGPQVFMELGGSGILFTLRFYTPIGARRDMMTKISEKILQQFSAAKPRIELAYTTTRSYSTTIENNQSPTLNHQ